MSTFRQNINSISESAQELRTVLAGIYQDKDNGRTMLQSLCLKFDDKNLFVFATEDDEVATSLCEQDVPWSDLQYIDQANSELWSNLIGVTMTGGWSMENRYGYNDAIQLHFAQLPSPILGQASLEFTRQVLAVGSELRLFNVVRIR